MATITFDNHRQATITIENIGNHISFLMNPVFDNSITNLKRDIQVCDSEETKVILERFYKYLESADTLDDKMNDDESIEDEMTLEFESGSCGDWCAVIHNIKAEHSGYWYAAQDLETEKCSLIKLRHELEGIKICTENINSVVTTLKRADSTDAAAAKMMEFGLDMEQAKAFMRIKLTDLTAYDPSYVSNNIELCDGWIKFIEDLTRN